VYSQKNSTGNHNSILPTIYISIHSPCYDYASFYPNVHALSVVATTRQNGTCDMLTSAKLSVGYLVVGILRELDKEPSLHCSSIYINTMWSMLQQYLSALMSIHCPHILLLIYHKATMLYTCALMSYS